MMTDDSWRLSWGNLNLLVKRYNDLGNTAIVDDNKGDDHLWCNKIPTRFGDLQIIMGNTDLLTW